MSEKVRRILIILLFVLLIFHASCAPKEQVPVYEFVESTPQKKILHDTITIISITETPRIYPPIYFNGFFTYKIPEDWLIYKTEKSDVGTITDILLDSQCANSDCSSLTIPDASIEIIEGSNNCASEEVEIVNYIKEYEDIGIVLKDKSEFYPVDYVDEERVYMIAVDFYFPESKSTSTDTFYVFKHNSRCFIINSSFIDITDPDIDDFRYLIDSVDSIIKSIKFTN